MVLIFVFPHENKVNEVTRQFPSVGLHFRDKKESWHESIQRTPGERG